MNPRRVVAGVALALALGACASPSSSADGDTASLQVEPNIVFLVAVPGTISGDPFTVTGTPRIVADSLFLTVQYGGGCARHDFSMVAQSGFMESFPVQLLIVLRHVNHNDLCKALLTRELRFNLSRIRDAYQQGYQQQHGTVLLRLRGFDAAIRYDF